MKLRFDPGLSGFKIEAFPIKFIVNLLELWRKQGVLTSSLRYVCITVITKSTLVNSLRTESSMYKMNNFLSFTLSVRNLRTFSLVRWFFLMINLKWFLKSSQQSEYTYSSYQFFSPNVQLTFRHLTLISQVLVASITLGSELWPYQTCYKASL